MSGDTIDQPSLALSASHLVGREVEVERVTATLIGGSGARSLLVMGEPGIGKSALLSRAATQARVAGMQVLVATGVETESQVPFAALHQLVRPVIDRTDSIPTRYRDAMLSAFGISETGVPDVFVVGLATLELVCDLATTSPVLLIVDDLHWIDAPTLDALAVVVRRIGDDPVSLLAACRYGYHTPLHDDLPDLPLERLDDIASQALLDSVVPDMDQAHRAQILDVCEGNPLALVELSRSSIEVGVEPAPLTQPGTPPVTRRVERAFAGRLSEVPAATRAIVLMASLDGGDSVAEVVEAAGAFTDRPVTLADASPAIAARLITITGPRIAFSHPLVRSAVQQTASLHERVAGHTAWARVLHGTPDRAVWHRAASTLGTDDTLAEDMEATASRARHRGGASTAQAALERAADLTSDPLRRAARLFDAAEIACELGRRDAVERILRVAQTLDRRPTSRARAVWISERFDDGLLGTTISVPALARLAVETHHLGNRDLALKLLSSAAIRCWWAESDQLQRQTVLDAFDQIVVEASEPVLVATLAWTAALEREHELTERLVAAYPRTDLDPGDSRLMGAAAICIGDHIMAKGFLDTAVDGLRQDGRLAWLAQSLLHRAWNSIHLMHLDSALADAAEGQRLAAESGQPLWVARGHSALATVAGLRGDIDHAEELMGKAERVAFPGRVSSVTSDVQLARGLIALSCRDYQGAFDHFRRMFDPADPGFHFVKRLWAIGDLAEAAARSGHHASALAVVAELRAFTDGSASPHIASSMRHATAVLAKDESADEEFRDALAATPEQQPFSRARLELAYGMQLRRRRRMAESRGLLRSSLATFDALGVTSWAQQARDELRASGETSRSRTPDALDQLTPQELQIARLAAEGLSNRDIAERLYLSPRTVGSHLYKIFPKLGVNSRSQLAAMLGALYLRPDPSTTRR